jgi:hypothetical protein
VLDAYRYRKNEVFLDVVERVNLLVNANGAVIRSEILGSGPSFSAAFSASVFFFLNVWSSDRPLQ